MTNLLFNDGRWTVLTASWTAASKGDQVEVCYVWSLASGIGLFDSSTGVSKTTLSMSMSEFIQRVNASGKICDLR